MMLERLLSRFRSTNGIQQAPLDVQEELRQVKQEVAALRESVAQLEKRKLCPVCMTELAAFAPKGRRKFARCTTCGAYERHRMIWLYLQNQTELLRKPTRLLHFAPEAGLRQRIKKYKLISYTTATYDPEKPDEGVNIQQLPYADASFDMVYCSHVLEHVPDDGKALRELFRVLAPGGLAVIMVPVREIPTTYEDPTITSPEERTKHFGQSDHLRVYGLDFPDRVRAAGFDLTTEYPADRFSPEDQVRYGIHTGEPVFAARKPAGV